MKGVTTVLIIYDTQTGNTGRMAEAVFEGASSVAGVKAVKHRLGEKFSMHELADASAIVVGSPTHYASVTSEMRHFLEAVDEMRKAKQIDLKEKIGAGFGSYGWSGEALERITGALSILGLDVTAKTLRVVEDPGPKDLDACRQLGKEVAEKAAKMAGSK